jgi:hypothetical protein
MKTNKETWNPEVKVNLNISLDLLIDQVEYYSKLPYWIDAIYFDKKEYEKSELRNEKINLDSKIIIEVIDEKVESAEGICIAKDGKIKITLRDILKAVKSIVCNSTQPKYNIEDDNRMRIFKAFHENNDIYLNSDTNCDILQVATGFCLTV